MFKFFSSTEKPTNTHTRSKTQPDALFSGNADAPSASTTIVNGQQFSFVEPPSTQPTEILQHEPLSSAPVAEPTRTHQRNLTEQVRSTRDLPPLITKATKSDIDRTSQATQKHSLTSSLEPCQLDVLPNPLTQSPTEPSQESSSTGSRRKQGKASEKASKVADWFKGESEPINLGILPSPTKEKADPFDSTGHSSEIRTSNLLQRRSTANMASKPALTSRFSFFTSKASLTKPAMRSLDLDDELIDLDISKALLSGGSPDPSSPAAFKTLQQQAEGLLTRLQVACKERTTSLREMAAEKEALAEETEGAETRARHLKTQLDDLSAKLAEQDEAMMNLVDELAQEKLARREEEEARKRSVRLVEQTTPSGGRRRGPSLSNSLSDSGFESEDDSSVESVFSRRTGAQSPALSMSSVSTSNSPEAYHAPNFQTSALRSQAARLRFTPAYIGKVGLGLHQNNIAEEPAQSTCANCKGSQASEAWSVVNVMTEENRYFKQRVGELEGALEGCLALVNNVNS